MSALDHGRLGVAAGALGIAQGLFRRIPYYLYALAANLGNVLVIFS